MKPAPPVTQTVRGPEDTLFVMAAELTATSPGSAVLSSGFAFGFQAMPRSDLKTALLLALLAFVLYNANFRPIAQGDSLPARYQPFLLWHHHTLYLDPMVELVAATNPHPHWILDLPNGHKASLYPVVTPLLVA